MFHSSSIFESLANSLPLSLLIKDRSGERVFANQAYLRWRGAKASEVIGKRDQDLFPPEIAAKFIADDQRVLETGESLHSVEETVSPTGETQWIERVKSPVRDENGNIIGVSLLFWDVTEKIKAETSRDHEQHLLTTLLENLPDSIYFKDRDSRFMRISVAMAKKFGMNSPKDVVGRTDADIFTGEHASGAREDELRIMHTGTPIVDQVERETWPDREDTWCMTTKMPLNDHLGKLIGTFGISRDVTELKHSQDALREAIHVADQANRAKSDFLANMSHEIRTPMNAIIGMTELLSQTKLDAEQQEFVALVSESADSLLRLLNDILDFSKIEARKLDLESIPFSLRETVGKAAQTLAIRASEKGLELACRIAPDVPDRFCGDPGRLRQILINLIGNAIKFTDVGEVVIDVTMPGPKPSTDSIGAPPATTGSDATTGYFELAFSVRDTGIGIAPEHQASVLEAFTQADTSTTRRYGGTGLGLSIAGQLIELMNGKLQLESEVGVGTTFYFSIRLKRAASRRDGDLAERLIELAGLPVLIVDDNATNRRILEEIFKAWKCRPWLVESGPDAIEAMSLAQREGRDFPLVVLDYMMPAMDGFQAAEAIRRDHGSSGTKIIMLSSASHLGDIQRCQQLRIDRFLSKPVLQSELLDSVLQALDIEPILELQSEEEALPPCPTLRVLVAEDGIANQYVATGMLKSLGHSSVVAPDGQEALRLWSEQLFDLILMDMHMPVMDGLEATRQIRQLEQQRGSHIPIIALTAAAMPKDVEACRDAGMDEYLSKPIHPRRLHEMLLRFASPHATDPPTRIAEPSSDYQTNHDEGHQDEEDEGRVCDLMRAASRIPGGMKGVRRLIEVFRVEADAMIRTLQSSIPAGDMKEARRAAHTLKGSAILFEAERVHRLAGKVEVCAEQGDASAAADLLPRLADAVTELLETLPS